MLRCIPLLLLFVLALPLCAEAAQKARLDITFSVNPAELLGNDRPAAGSGAEQAELPKQSMHAMIYWSEEQLRCDMVGNRGVPPSSVIYDYSAGEFYTVDHGSRSAMRMDISALQQEGSLMGLDVESPQQMLFNWEQLQRLRGLPGVSYTDLGTKVVSGSECLGFELGIDLRRLAASSEGKSDSNLQFLAALTPTMEITALVSTELELPLWMQIRMRGVSTDMSLSGIGEFPVSDSFFEVPKDYRVEDGVPFSLPASSELETTST